MSLSEFNKDELIGLEIKGYVIKNYISSGKVGAVFIAEEDEFHDQRAVKFVLKSLAASKPNWKQEIGKVIKLKKTEGVVQYHENDEITVNGKEFVYIVWDYIDSDSLRDLINTNSVTIPMLVDIAERVLDVIYACQQAGIHHSDLHAGNVLIEKPNPLSMDSSRRKVWITDFGYGSFSDEISPVDDYLGFARMIQDCIASIDFHSLEKEERIIYSSLKDEFPKFLLEQNIMEGDYVRNPKGLKGKMYSLFRESPQNREYKKNVGDFLAAELIGDRYDEWRLLFVPKFLAASELLDKNICILTGLRGCGKTMIFKRLSFPLTIKLGPSGILEEESFVGFYLNARHIAEAFPWLPEKYQDRARNQVIQFFHLRWCIDILTWLRGQISNIQYYDLRWLTDFFSNYFPYYYDTAEDNNFGRINHLVTLMNQQLQESKLESQYSLEKVWTLVDYDFLEKFVDLINQNVSFAKGKAFYFFLDDYSTPMVTVPTQNILNPIVFRRSSTVFFKVSTESSESFVPKGLNGKILEEGADYKLIDLGAEVFARNDSEIQDIITTIFSKRIERNVLFANKSISLQDILGKSELNNIERARRIREGDTQVLYYGLKVFCDLWSSDVRELIKIFASMISMEGDESIGSKVESTDKDQPIISVANQDNVMRDAGVKFLNLLAAAIDPSDNKCIDSEEPYGSHLVDIAKAFQSIAYYELKNKDSKNQGKVLPKQARKIEITTMETLSQQAHAYFKGLIRYGVFLQGSRAKSVRGAIAVRLYFRSLLIPHCRITFSKRDNIMLEWDEFEMLLLKPNEFKEIYIKKQNKAEKHKKKILKDQIEIELEQEE